VTLVVDASVLVAALVDQARRASGPNRSCSTDHWSRRTYTVRRRYVAVAESLGVVLATLDERLGRAPGPRCAFVIPPG
jgi:predicted nucleic acid-binding protein